MVKGKDAITKGWVKIKRLMKNDREIAEMPKKLK